MQDREIGITESKASTKDGGRWGVVPASEHQEIFVALASLIRAHRYDMALKILNQELGNRP